jgi:hypothetical protein
MLTSLKGSRVQYPRGTWLTMLLLIGVFGAFGLWVYANADIPQTLEITRLPSPLDPLMQIFVAGK